MDRRTQDEQIEALSARYHVPSQEVARWIEQGYAINDVDWAYRFADTSPISDVAKLLTMRAEGMTWDDVRRTLEDMRRGERSPYEDESGRRLVPGGERRTSRYFYRDNPRLPNHERQAASDEE